ncbi:hypothetical protein BJV82DRAFT_511765, partial [Fennellomyces sp. T-0311]
GPRAILQLFFEEPSELETALQKGLVFKNNVVIKPCRALTDDTQLMNVRISRLPFMNEKKLKAGIIESFSLYGCVLDCGVYKHAE